MNIVLYHANCYDGFCAAWIAKRCLKDAIFLPVQYGENPPWDLIDNNMVYILDFCYRDHTEEIINRAKHLTLLDHHETSLNALRKIPQGSGFKIIKDSPTNFELQNYEFHIIFNLGQSGARLTAEYFDHDDHWLINYTEDRDLWKWELKDSKVINNGLRTYEFDFDVWNNIIKEECFQRGKILTDYFDGLVEGAVANAEEYTLNTPNGELYKVRAVNCTMSDIISETAEKLCEGVDFGMTYFYTGEKFVYSLRSRNDINVADIAKEFGGGGHPQASGFRHSEFILK